MAVTPVTLKSNTFLDLDSVKDWLKIPLTNTDHDNRVTRLINMVTDMAERYIGGPIKDQTYVEERDGDSSDTIVPDFWPIRSITELRVDYNRGFGTETMLIPADYFLRGPKKISSVGMNGTDIVVRGDSNSTATLGSLIVGSVVGCIKLTYVAGRGVDATEIPYDIQQAILLGVEYFYILRENREMGVKSKTTNGQNYSRDLGLPKEVCDLLDQYVDFAIPHINKPQSNRTGI